MINDHLFNTCMKKACIPRNVAVGNLSKARRTLLTMACSQQPDWRMMTEMYSSSVTGLMQILPGLRRPDTRIILNNWEQFNSVIILTQLVVKFTNINTFRRLNYLHM